MRNGKPALALLLALLLGGCGRGPAGDAGATLEPGGEAAAPATEAFGAVDRTRLLAADSEPGNWFTLGRDFGESRYSPLDLIDETNVAELGFAWEYRTGTRRGLEATPIVVDGVLYASGTWSAVYALDAGTGEELWRFHPELDRGRARWACCDIVNRGVAVWDGMVYVAGLDGQLFGLDARTGALRWSVDTIVDRKRGYTITGAPRIAGDVVVIGNSGAEFDARGYISAYALKTGALRWRFYTVPGDPKLGFEHPELEWAAKTWDPDSRWDVGLGGTVWDSMVYDPELDLLYVGTGNATPYNAAERSPSGGDNLFVASILAIDPGTGRLAWHYQQVPGDAWDYTSTQNIILADLEIGGEPRKVLLHAPKNGFFYVIDRTDGELLSAEPFVPVTWATHVDLSTGRPAVSESADYSAGPALVAPAAVGAHNWQPMAFNPLTGLVYIPAFEIAMIVYDRTPGEHTYVQGAVNQGAEFIFVDPDDAVLAGLLGNELPTLEELSPEWPVPEMRTLLRAWDPIAGQSVWDREIEHYWLQGGVLTTGGNLVFQGLADGTFNICAADTGAHLRAFDTGTSIMAGAATYLVDGEQYVAVLAGEGGAARWQHYRPGTAAATHGNAGRILAFKLGGGPVPKPPPIERPPMPEPPAAVAAAIAGEETVARGGALFVQWCVLCHFNLDYGGGAPNLLRMQPPVHERFNDIVLRGTLVHAGMPGFGDVLTEQDAGALHAYLIDAAHEAWAGGRGGQEQ